MMNMNAETGSIVQSMKFSHAAASSDVRALNSASDYGRDAALVSSAAAAAGKASWPNSEPPCLPGHRQRFQWRSKTRIDPLLPAASTA